MHKGQQKTLLAIGGLAVIVGVAYYVHKKYGTFSQTQKLFGNPVTPQAFIHGSGQTPNQQPYPMKKYSGFVPQYQGWVYDYGTSQSTGAASGAGGLRGNGGIL